MGYSADDNSVNITQALMVQLNLKTTKDGSKPVAAPKDGNTYAICDSKWHDLDVIDYALLSTLAYYDMEDPLEDIATRMFPFTEGVTVTQPFYVESHEAAQVSLLLKFVFSPP